MSDRDDELRAHAFAWLREQHRIYGDVLDATLLRRGFEVSGQRVPLIVQQGIFKPKGSECALSIRTAVESPYDDGFVDEDTLVYSYQGEDPASWDNVALRKAMEQRRPLVYLFGVSRSPKRYAAVHPVFVIAEDSAAKAFRVQAELPSELRLLGSSTGPGETMTVADGTSRAYGTRLARTRLHQARFREQVLAAYRQQCAMCRLKHRSLLDAAHIVPDRDERGDAVVANGLSLCKIHHAAFDGLYLSVAPDDYRVHLRADLLDEDGRPDAPARPAGPPRGGDSASADPLGPAGPAAARPALGALRGVRLGASARPAVTGSCSRPRSRAFRPKAGRVRGSRPGRRTGRR